MSRLAVDAVQAAQRMPLRAGDVVYVTRKTLLSPANVPELAKILTPCRVKSTKLHGIDIEVLGTGRKWDEPAEIVFCTKSQHYIFTSYLEALEKVAQLLHGISKEIEAQAENVAAVLAETQRLITKELEK